LPFLMAPGPFHEAIAVGCGPEPERLQPSDRERATGRPERPSPLLRLTRSPFIGHGHHAQVVRWQLAVFRRRVCVSSAFCRIASRSSPSTGVSEKYDAPALIASPERRAATAGHHHALHIWAGPFELTESFQGVHIGQRQIDDDDVGIPVSEDLSTSRLDTSGPRVVSGICQQRVHPPGKGRLIVSHQRARNADRGRGRGSGEIARRRPRLRGHLPPTTANQQIEHDLSTWTLLGAVASLIIKIRILAKDTYFTFSTTARCEGRNDPRSSGAARALRSVAGGCVRSCREQIANSVVAWTNVRDNPGISSNSLRIRRSSISQAATLRCSAGSFAGKSERQQEPM
jgi:hypothetical protein